MGNPGTPSYAEASLTSAKMVRTIAQVTGHVLDQQRLRGFYEDPAEEALASATAALMTGTEGVLLGSEANHSLAAAVDSADVYASLDPATYTKWASVETAVSGALSETVLKTAYRTLTDPPRGARPDRILSGSTQLDRYLAILGPSATNVQAQPRQDQGRPYDLGMRNERASYNGIPWSLVRGMTASELYMLDIASGVEVRFQRDVETKLLASTDDSTRYQISQGFILKITDRYRHAKLTGLTTP